MDFLGAMEDKEMPKKLPNRQNEVSMHVTIFTIVTCFLWVILATVCILDRNLRMF